MKVLGYLRAILGFACVSVTVVAALGGCFLWPETVPDTHIRNAVAKLKPSDVAAVKLDIPSHFLVLTHNGKAPSKAFMKCHEFPSAVYVVERNPDAMTLLLQGLQEARAPRKAMPRIHHITLLLRSGKVIGPFDFWYGMRTRNISPTFVQGLKKAGLKEPKH